MNHQDWIQHLEADIGIRCAPSGARFHEFAIKKWNLGAIKVLDVWMGGGAAFPVEQRHGVWADEPLFLTVVLSGDEVLEQDGRVQRVAAGSMMIHDLHHFVATIPEVIHLGILCLPRQTLLKRGICPDLPSVVQANTRLPELNLTRDFVQSIIRHSAEVKNSYGLRLEEQVFGLMDTIFDEIQPTQHDVSRKETLSRVQRFIHKNIGDADLDSQVIAEAMGLSVNYLNRLFNMEGTSLMRYVWALRLDHARRLLSDGLDRRIGEVAFRCGFSDLAHFSRAFRSRYGVTPSKARLPC